jgi:hypothetical protein
MSKSLGGLAAANALAEARAAAEARVSERERNKEQENKRAVAHIAVASTSKEEKAFGSLNVVRSLEEGRLSVSDLVAAKSDVKDKEPSQDFSKVFPIPSAIQVPTLKNTTNAVDESTSTTPPNSPPSTRPTSFKLPSGPVFNKPPPVFVPPPTAPVTNQKSRAVTSVKDFSFNLPAPTFSVPAPMGLGTRVSPSSFKSKQPVQLSAQSTLESIVSERVFDAEDGVPAWMPGTQDTEYSFESQPLTQNGRYQHMNELDEDDSWPLNEKLSAGPIWTFGQAAKEDSATWSTLPTQSQRADSGPVQCDGNQKMDEESFQQGKSLVAPGTFGNAVDEEYDEDYLGLDESEIELEEAGKMTVGLVQVRCAVLTQCVGGRHSIILSRRRIEYLGARVSCRWPRLLRHKRVSLVRRPSWSIVF